MSGILAMPHELDDWARTLGLVAGLLLSIGVIIKAGVSVGHFFRKAARVFDKIERELNNNGGSSLMDKVDTMGDTVKSIDNRLGDVEAWREAADARVAHLELVHEKQMQVEAIVSQFTQRKAQ